MDHAKLVKNNALDDAHRSDDSMALKALRNGLVIVSNNANKPGSYFRLKADVGNLLRNCSEFWNDLGDVTSAHDPIDELETLPVSGRQYEIRSTWASERNSFGGSRPKSYNNLLPATLDEAPHAGTAFAASVGTGVVSMIPSVISGTQSVFSTLVHSGAQSVIPQYTLLNGRMVIDHYTILTAPSAIHGWVPQAISTLSPLSVPIFGSMFALAYGLDGMHGYMNNQCSGQSALANIARGALTGTAIGLSYFSLVSLVGITFAPAISSGLCLLWLFRLFATNSLSPSDLAIGTAGNICGISAFLLSGNPFVSLFASAVGGLIGSNIYSIISLHWRTRLQNRLVETSREILNIESTQPTRSEIDSAYRREARKNHPDKFEGKRERFELVAVAREILILDLNQRIEEESKNRMNSWTNFFNEFKKIVDTFVVGPSHTVDDRTRRSLASATPPPKSLSNRYLFSPD
jgi:hypothetical protein